MHPKPPVISPDAEEWAVDYLTDALADRDEDYAANVTVSNGVGEANTGRLVTVRDDGGPRLLVTKSVALGLNVWADTEADASDLARLVVALLEAAPGSDAVVGHSGTSGPTRVPEQSERPHWFASVDLLFRGTAL